MEENEMNNIKWLFFDVGSTIVDEHIAYEHRMQEIADSAKTTYDNVYKTAMSFYKQNKKGDLETAKLLGVELTKWHKEDEILYEDAVKCLEILSSKYKIGVIANQELGTKERLEQHGILQYIDLVIASAEEGVAKPDKKIFEIALERGMCSPDNAIMIGDRVDNDIIPAKLLGMHTIWIKQGFGQYWNITEEIEKPDYIVHSLIDLCNIL
jgi:HAD superfamily hydrolase (TIGR01549 family)